MQASTSLIKLLFLISLLHVSILICAIILQRLEHSDVADSDANLVKFLESFRREILFNDAETMAEELRHVYRREEDRKTKTRLNNLENAYLFTMTSFMVLGNSRMTPIVWQGKLFYSVVIPFGFALYVIVIVATAYHLRDLLSFCIVKIEKKNVNEIPLLSTKILVMAFATCCCIIQIGGVISVTRGDHYFNGVYVAIDTMTFAGNEAIARGPMKLIFSFLLSFYYVLLHGFVLVFVCNLQLTWSEIVDFVGGNETRATCFYQQSHYGPGDSYKDKLLASFDSPSSLTPPNEREAESDVLFPQLWSMQYDFEPDMLNEPLMVGQTERRDSRFSEIFNAQKDLFEPIMEGAENPDDDLSETSSYKSTKDYFITDELQSRLGNYTRDLDDVTVNEDKKMQDELSSGQSTPTCGGSESLPSSFSNISMDEWDANIQ